MKLNGEYFIVKVFSNTIRIKVLERGPFVGQKKPRSKLELSTKEWWQDYNARKPNDSIGANVVEMYERVKKEHRQKYKKRVKKDLIELINLNFYHKTAKHLTLTFKENLTDIEEAYYRHTKFISKLRYRYGNFKFVTVTEFQKRGAIHFHQINNLPFIKKDILDSLWGSGRGIRFEPYGLLFISPIKNKYGLGRYLCKYLVKDIDDPRLRDKKAFSTSRKMKRPKIIKGYAGSLAEKIAIEYVDNYKPVYEIDIPSVWNGIIYLKDFIKRDILAKQT
ncbi:MAG: hypothetical protein JXI43_10310 [Tissierellales bacterium]|nr:hypothetical protein [Tissierellales bacterium]